MGRPFLDAPPGRRDEFVEPYFRRAKPDEVEDVVADNDLALAVRRLAPDGLAAWQQVLERGYEGLVAKDEASPYEGGPTTRWLKV